jgi:hypothetical protein
MSDTKECSNCGSHRAFRVSLTKTDQGKFKQVESDRNWLELLAKAKTSQPFAAGALATFAALDRFDVLKFYFCPACHHFQR